MSGGCWCWSCPRPINMDLKRPVHNFLTLVCHYNHCYFWTNHAPLIVFKIWIWIKYIFNIFLKLKPSELYQWLLKKGHQRRHTHMHKGIGNTRLNWPQICVECKKPCLLLWTVLQENKNTKRDHKNNSCVKIIYIFSNSFILIGRLIPSYWNTTSKSFMKSAKRSHKSVYLF